MARTQTVVLICDDPRHYDDTEASYTRRLSVDGAEYEFDLCTPHDNEYGRALAPYLACARPVAARRATQRKGTRSVEHRRRTAAVRAWWHDHPVTGVRFTELGRIPAPVLAAYARRT